MWWRNLEAADFVQKRSSFEDHCFYCLGLETRTGVLRRTSAAIKKRATFGEPLGPGSTEHWVQCWKLKTEVRGEPGFGGTMAENQACR